VWPVNVEIAVCDGTSQTFTVVSSEQDMTSVLFGEKRVTWTGLLVGDKYQWRSEPDGRTPDTYKVCSFIVLKMARLFTSNTCTNPSSPPATTNLPSLRNSAPRAVSLNRVMVLTTLPVFGAYMSTLEEEVTANRWGLVGEKWIAVIG
jgi:hypothetical protein